MARAFFRSRKSCPFSGKDAPKIDYKDVRLLQGFMSERGKIVPSRITAVSTKKQREHAQRDRKVTGAEDECPYHPRHAAIQPGNARARSSGS